MPYQIHEIKEIFRHSDVQAILGLFGDDFVFTHAFVEGYRKYRGIHARLGINPMPRDTLIRLVVESDTWAAIVAKQEGEPLPPEPPRLEPGQDSDQVSGQVPAVDDDDLPPGEGDGVDLSARAAKPATGTDQVFEGVPVAEPVAEISQAEPEPEGEYRIMGDDPTKWNVGDPCWVKVKRGAPKKAIFQGMSKAGRGKVKIKDEEGNIQETSVKPEELDPWDFSPPSKE